MLELKDIVKEYLAGENKVVALNNVNLAFRESEFVSVLGPSGCGKTTLLNIIGGLDRYTSGDLIIGDKSTKDFKDRDWDTYRNHKIGFVFQSYNLIMHLSVLENVELALSIAGISKKEKRERAIEALKTVGLGDQIKKKPNQLSGGQMQRVAIARAIVNNPEIILADEPTGALDSEISLQVLDILKEISKDKLVIMVTHNTDLAEKYSTRIVNMLDGKIIGDSNPIKKAELRKLKKAKEKAINKKASMSVWTAFSLSFKNLWSKKAKTILTSFAGSIGIIGVALVLAVSAGFTNYISSLQSDTLGGYPLAVSQVAIDYDAITGALGSGVINGDGSQIEIEDGELGVYDLSQVFIRFGKYNYISSSFLDYMTQYYNEDLEKPEERQELNAMRVGYATQLKILTEYEGNVVYVDNTESTSSLRGTTSSTFYEGFSDREFVLEHYDVVAGQYPTSRNEVALVIGENNTISKQLLESMRIELPSLDAEKLSIEDDILGKTYKIATNDIYYVPDDVANPTSFTPSTDYAGMYSQIGEDWTITISCVLRLKEDATSNLLDEGIMYLPSLATTYRTNCRNSFIAQKTLELVTEDWELTSPRLYQPFVLDISELNMVFDQEISQAMFTFYTPYQMQQTLKEQFGYDMTNAEVIEIALQTLGASELPTGILFYPKTFDAKSNLLNYINEWNDAQTVEANKIVYTDSTEFLTSTMGQLINIISYVLIAFASISLVVSSIMIGIITYTSVIERTKEIGVLRSIGARKKDISRVFNAETFIIGFAAGLIGIALTYILCIPISAIISSVSGGVLSSNFAVLDPISALILVGISIVLTLISGLIPARIASKKDPVVALRTD